MYFKLIMLVVAIYVCGLTAFSLGMILANKRKTWYLKVAQSFGLSALELLATYIFYGCHIVNCLVRFLE